MHQRYWIPAAGLFVAAVLAGLWLLLAPPGAGRDRLREPAQAGLPGDLCSAGSEGNGPCSGDAGSDRNARPSGPGLSRDESGGEGTDADDESGEPIFLPPLGGDSRTPEAEASKTGDPAETAGTDQPKQPMPARAVIRGVKKPPQTLGNRRPKARKVGEASVVRGLDEATAELLQDRRGLLGRYYVFSGNPLDELTNPDLPPLDSRTPELTRIDRQVHFASREAFETLPFELDNFFAVWEGFLVIQEPADYWLFFGSDDGGRVVIDGETVLLNDSFHDYIEVSTVLTLEAGLHPLRIEFTQFLRDNTPIPRFCACNLMWVPQGESKPAPVPEEMLLLPESLWTDSVPRVESIQPTAAGVGDQVVIRGKNFLTGETGEELEASRLSVDFQGQPGVILSASDTEITARVPIGASSGYLTVRRDEIPSNAAVFGVTTQTGLLASWHDLWGWSGYDYVEPGERQPEVVRLEPDFPFANRNELDLEFRDHPLACRWEGRLGIPLTLKGRHLLRFRAEGRLRIRLGDMTRETGADVTAENPVTILDFELMGGEEAYLPLEIDYTAQGSTAGLSVEWTNFSGSNKDVAEAKNWETVAVPMRFFYPAVAPPKPPRILLVEPLYDEGEVPPTGVWETEPGLVSIREGQRFRFVLEVYGDSEIRSQPVHVFADGIEVDYYVPQGGTEPVGEYGERWSCEAALPIGVGEGVLKARQTIVESEPYQFDVWNKGLIAYLYDLPDAGGYKAMPDFQPLVAFQVRKDRSIDYENANHFGLPFPAETFGIEWFGGLLIEEPGNYVFTARSDDGVLLWIDGVLVLEDNNLHYQREKSSEPIFLGPGVHTFQMQFFENNVHEVCVLEFEALDGGGDPVVQRQVIPPRLFTIDVHPPLPDKTSTGKLADGSDPP